MRKVRPEEVMKLAKVLMLGNKEGQIQTQEEWLHSPYFLNHSSMEVLNNTNNYSSAFLKVLKESQS